MRRALVSFAILLAAAPVAGCGKDASLAGGASKTDAEPPVTTATQATPATTAAPATTARTATPSQPVVPRSTDDGCKAVPAPKPSSDPDRRRPRRRLSAGRRYTAIVRTNCGTFAIRLDVARAPKTTSSFAALVRSRFFDGLTFHRIANPGGNDYVIQGGDPLGSGNGGPGYTVVERPPRHLRYTRYTVAMAKTITDRPGTSGSQFFIVTAPEAPLPPDYALLGRVVGGKRVIRRIAAVPTDPTTEMPLDAVVISSIRIGSTAR